MPDSILEPLPLPWNFWDSDSFDFPEHRMFFFIPIKGTSDVASLGWWDGKEIIWLLEHYHASGNELIFYTFKDEEMIESSKQEWFAYAQENTPQCMDWILFRLSELKLT